MLRLPNQVPVPAFIREAHDLRTGDAAAMPDPEQIFLEPDDGIPNSPLPVLIYRAACPEGAAALEELFLRNGWSGLWRDGVFDFHHYHSRGHEVLGVAAGSARLALGGPGGRDIDVTAGDVLVLPAGTGHRRIGASSGFLVVGGYPPGQEGDICRPPATPEQRRRIASLPLPDSDPVLGDDGLTRLWKNLPS